MIQWGGRQRKTDSLPGLPVTVQIRGGGNRLFSSRPLCEIESIEQKKRNKKKEFTT